MQIRSVGIDLGKTTFHLVALGAAGKVLVKKKFRQRQLLTYTANMQTSLIGLEACAGAHFLGRELRSDGVRVTIFRHVLQNGQWVDSGVSPVTIGEIENKVLSRARELREQSLANS